MQTKVLTVGPDTPIPELVDFLIARRITGVPVVEGGKVVGIVSRSDLVRAVSLERALAGFVDDAFGEAAHELGEGSVTPAKTVMPQLQERTVRSIMAPDPTSVAPDTPVEEIARILIRDHVHRVVVTDGDRLAGLVTSLDLVRLFTDGRAST